MYSWVAVVILPITSSVNPLIYTILAAMHKKVTRDGMCLTLRVSTVINKTTVMNSKRKNYCYLVLVKFG